VKDTGVGISGEDLGNLFRIEQRHSTPGTEKEMGTGLGLIICKELIEIQGGTIGVKSKLGEGTEFTVSLQYLGNN
jgi:signal transduction histidine kinase